MSKLNHDHSLPNHFSILTPEDQQGYFDLKDNLRDSNRNNKKKNGIDTFADLLQMIKKYAFQSSTDVWKRFLVCGIAWTQNDYVAINTHQLHLLLGKCKSSINGSLHRLGYSALGFRGESSSELVDTIPFLKTSFQELRQWTIRKIGGNENSCSPPPPSVPSKSDQSTCSLTVPSSKPAQDFYHEEHPRSNPPRNLICLEDFEPNPLKNDEYYDDLSDPYTFWDNHQIHHEPYSLDSININFEYL